MFKYTPPWQVLCNSMEHEAKRQSTAASDNPQDVPTQGEEQILSHSHQPSASPAPPPAQEGAPSRAPMESTPRNWVIKTMSPTLDFSDLRDLLSPSGEPPPLEGSWSCSQDGGHRFSFDSISVARSQSSVTVSSLWGEGAASDVVVQARQVAVSEEGSVSEDWQPSSPSSPSTPTSSASSRCGFYSLVEDPTSPEAERNEAYMTSPERQAKLATLKQESSFKLQTYAEERRPERLFDKLNGDSRYRVEDVPVKEEEGPDRQQIIRSQAPKKNPISTLESLDLSNSLSARLVEGFSLCYGPVSPKPEQPAAEPGTIDNEQIDFNTARKQFLMMEQSKLGSVLQSPRQLSHSPKQQHSTERLSQSPTPSKRQSEGEASTGKQTTVKVIEDVEAKRQRSAFDDHDSGLGDQSEVYVSDELCQSEADHSPSVVSYRETPIDREIRTALAREESLRRARGLKHSDTAEMVEIKTKHLLSQPASPLKPNKAKDGNRVSFLIRWEIEKDSKREEALLHQGRHSGLYDHDTTQELCERKRIFELHADHAPVMPVRMSLSECPVSVESDLLDTEEYPSPCCPHEHPDELPLQIARQNSSQSTGHRWTGRSSVKVLPSPYPEDGVLSKDAEKWSETGTSPCPAWWGHLDHFSPRTRMLHAPDIIRREIEEDLRREQEHLELRESSSLSASLDGGLDNLGPMAASTNAAEHDSQNPLLSLHSPPRSKVDSVFPGREQAKTISSSQSYSWSVESSPIAQISDKTTYYLPPRPTARLPLVTIMTAQPWSNPRPASPVVSRVLPVMPSSPRPETPSSPRPETPSTPTQKGLTETLLEDYEERRVKLKLEESAYAGIQPIDDVNNEVLEATRVTRHKNTRALRWEAGVFANEDGN